MRLLHPLAVLIVYWGTVPPSGQQQNSPGQQAMACTIHIHMRRPLQLSPGTHIYGPTARWAYNHQTHPVVALCPDHRAPPSPRMAIKVCWDLRPVAVYSTSMAKMIPAVWTDLNNRNSDVIVPPSVRISWKNWRRSSRRAIIRACRHGNVWRQRLHCRRPEYRYVELLSPGAALFLL